MYYLKKGTSRYLSQDCPLRYPHIVFHGDMLNAIMFTNLKISTIDRIYVQIKKLLKH